MNMTQRLTARDLIAKSFSAKARRGYDPAEVDAYLMDVARQVDELNLEIDRLTNEVVRLSFAQPQPDRGPSRPAPPPPVAAAAPAMTSDAADESFKLILRAAQKTAEQAIGDARLRGEEIIAEAKYRAAEINRDSDRKAFEAASRTQEDLVRLEDELKRRRIELDSVRRAIEAEKEAVRDMANSLLTAIGDKDEEEDMAAQQRRRPGARRRPHQRACAGTGTPLRDGQRRTGSAASAPRACPRPPRASSCSSPSATKAERRSCRRQSYSDRTVSVSRHTSRAELYSGAAAKRMTSGGRTSTTTPAPATLARATPRHPAL